MLCVRQAYQRAILDLTVRVARQLLPSGGEHGAGHLGRGLPLLLAFALSDGL